MKKGSEANSPINALNEVAEESLWTAWRVFQPDSQPVHRSFLAARMWPRIPAW